MRYHEWILQQLRKEREMETTDCTYCGQVHLTVDSLEKTVWLKQSQEVTYHYCSQQCLQEHYLAKLTAQLYE